MALIRTLQTVMPVVLCAAALAQQPRENGDAPAGPKLTLSERSWDVGEIWQGEKYEHEFTIKNSGDADVTGLKVRGTCGCVKPAIDAETLAPGESAKVAIQFDSKTKSGKTQVTVIIESDSVSQPALFYQVHSDVRPIVETDPPTGMTLDAIVGQKDVVGRVRLVNNYSDPLRPRIRKLDSEWFDVRIEILTEGRRYLLIVTPKKKLPEGITRGSVEIETGIKRMPGLTVPLVAKVRPLVMATPPALLIPKNGAQSIRRFVRLAYYGGELDFKVLSVRSPHESISVLAETAVPVNRRAPGAARFQVPITVFAKPAEMPDGGVEIEITTNAEGYEHLTVLVTNDPARFRKRVEKQNHADADEDREADDAREQPTEGG
jgi:hypothetical protein